MLDQNIALRRSGSDLPSRVADNLFWLGRYAERSENSVRLFRSMVLRLAGEAGAGEDPQTLSRLTNILVDFGYLKRQSARKAAAGGIRTVEREMANLLFEWGSPIGLIELLGNLQRTSSLVRERLSVDSWRVLNGLNRRVKENAAIVRLDFDDVLGLLNHILENLAAFSGMQMENMTRTLGWQLLDSGRRLERTAHMAKLIRELAVEGDPAGEGGLDLMLELGDSSMTYRTRYLSSVQLPAVVDLLLVDDTNPRSVAFQLAALDDHMEALPHDRESASLPTERYLIASMRSALTLIDIHDVCARANRRG
ncbi:MAG: alpha-E domain-containing protein, partial [Rhodospirillaceae bacterium]